MAPRGERRRRRASAPPAELPPLDAVFLTHHHWDHVHPDACSGSTSARRSTCPSRICPRPLASRTEALLRYLGGHRLPPARHADRTHAPHDYLRDSLDEITATVTAAGAQLQLSRPFDRFAIGRAG
ncbi:MAG: MBL fold metallo-hydrolase [Kofleriaceae bacterium]